MLLPPWFCSFAILHPIFRMAKAIIVSEIFIFDNHYTTIAYDYITSIRFSFAPANI